MFSGKSIICLERYVRTDNRPVIRDRSLITGRGGLQNGKIAGPKLFAPPPPQDNVKLFEPPRLKSGNFSCPPYNMAKTSSYRVKTTPKLFVLPLQHGNNFFRPPFDRGKTPRALSLPVISDQSLIPLTFPCGTCMRH